MPVKLLKNGRYRITIYSDETESGYRKHVVDREFLEEYVNWVLNYKTKEPDMPYSEPWPPDIEEWATASNTYVSRSPCGKYKAVIARVLGTGGLACKFEGENWLSTYGVDYPVEELIDMLRKEYALRVSKE